MPITKVAIFAFVLIAVVVVMMRTSAARTLDQSTFDNLYSDPAAIPNNPQRIFHIGHSLVGRDMPAMVAQLVGEGHQYESQLGWGTALKAHWDPDEPINGFEAENAHPRYRDAAEAVQSGEYDAVVLTEMVEIRDAIKYHDTPTYLHRWARAVWDANPDAGVYLYETWHRTDDAEGWLERLDKDLGRYWENGVLRPGLAKDDAPRPIYVIPAGQVLAAFVRKVEAEQGVDGLRGRDDLFADEIHLNDLGAYLVALTHYAVLYQTSPVGLPHVLDRADGSPAQAPSAAAAQLMQETVWEVVTGYKRTGLP